MGLRSVEIFLPLQCGDQLESSESDVYRPTKVYPRAVRVDPAQHFSCSVKTVECGQIFLLACLQFWKKGSA